MLMGNGFSILWCKQWLCTHDVPLFLVLSNGLFSLDNLDSLSLLCWLQLIGMWCVADGEGRTTARSRISKILVFLLILSLLLTVYELCSYMRKSDDDKNAAMVQPSFTEGECVDYVMPNDLTEKPYYRDRGNFLTGRGVYEIDDHPLSSLYDAPERLSILDWVTSSPPICLVERVSSIIKSKEKRIVISHTSLDREHFSVLLNLMVSLHRTGLGVEDVLLVVYNYEPISKESKAILDAYGFQYMMAWDFGIPGYLFKESQLTAPQFFFVRNVIHIKLLKMGYHLLHMDSDVIILNGSPFDELDPTKYAIEAASAASPFQQRLKWGFTLNCGVIAISPVHQMVEFYQSFVVFSFDFVEPIDQWGLNQYVDSKGQAKFDVHTDAHGELVKLPLDHGPLVGNITADGTTLGVRTFDPRIHLTGRWLNYADRALPEPFHKFAAKNFGVLKSVHVTHMQGGVLAKVAWMKQSSLWFLKDDWEIVDGSSPTLASLDNGVHAPGW